jgi:hypothetical protein
MTRRMFVVNCAFWLRAGWAIVKHFLDQKTRDKIKIYGDDYQSELFEYADPANLPEFLSGTCRCEPHGCLMQYAGPWAEVLDHMPKDEDDDDLNVPPPPAKWKLKLDC